MYNIVKMVIKTRNNLIRHKIYNTGLGPSHNEAQSVYTESTSCCVHVMFSHIWLSWQTGKQVIQILKVSSLPSTGRENNSSHKTG